MTDQYLIDTHALQVTCDPLASLVLIGAWTDQCDRLKDHLRDVLGMALDGPQQTAIEAGNTTFYPVTPYKWLIASPKDANHFARLRKGFSTRIGSLSDQSHGRMAFSVRGPQGSALLARGLPLDPAHHMRNKGRFVQTRMHDANVLVHRRDVDHFVMLVPTSFAHSVGDWMIQACKNITN